MKYYKNNQTSKHANKNSNKQATPKTGKRVYTGDPQEAFTAPSSMHLTQFSYKCEG